MNPGIYYLYEYKNQDKLRNVGFLRVSQNYHTIVLKINARRIPVQSGDTVDLFAFYEQSPDIISRKIAVIPCENESVTANLSIPDSMLPGNKTLESIDGFFFRTPTLQFIVAATEESNFDTRNIREEVPEPSETENAPGAETGRIPAAVTGAPPATGIEGIPTAVTGVPPASGIGEIPTAVTGVPPTSGIGGIPTTVNGTPPDTAVRRIPAPPTEGIPVPPAERMPAPTT
ncbi:MAG TPA: hypothetical protein DIW07_09075, partial [Lachnospiraceae bacterium]|nr:hypothetical protein [Lachnospiraceae bacterium]